MLKGKKENKLYNSAVKIKITPFKNEQKIWVDISLKKTYKWPST